MKYEAAVSRRLLAEVAAGASGCAPAERQFRESMHALDSLGAEGELALACAGYGRFCGRRGRLSEARRHLGRALEIVERLGVLGEADALRADLGALG
jgi:hypothetical protein